MKKRTFLQSAYLVLLDIGGIMTTDQIIKEVFERKLWERRGRSDTAYNSLYGTLIKAVQADDKRIGRVANTDKFYALVEAEKPKKNKPVNIELFQEGGLKQVVQNRYERNPRARRICLDYHGVRCSACGFDFEEFYGELGQGYTHVYHVIPVADRNATYFIDPILDLIPVCPNCHSMIHRVDPILDIEQLKEFIYSHGKSLIK